jgi:hypothetical protein
LNLAVGRSFTGDGVHIANDGPERAIATLGAASEPLLHCCSRWLAVEKGLKNGRGWRKNHRVDSPRRFIFDCVSAAKAGPGLIAPVRCETHSSALAWRAADIRLHHLFRAAKAGTQAHVYAMIAARRFRDSNDWSRPLCIEHIATLQ